MKGSHFDTDADLQKKISCFFIFIAGIVNSWHPTASKTIPIHTLEDQDGGVHTSFVDRGHQN